ncbi:hypothetical protein [Frateuria sp.]|uniref:hypothetical protein n=1 Tax=Frateuria sp. TaxID=2211372 RepID=UPI003F7E589A
MSLFSGGLGLALFLFLFILAALWFLLPFAVFGIKDKLGALIEESKKSNAELARITAELLATRSELARVRQVQGIADGV